MNIPKNFTSMTPYMLRAFYEWMVENSLTPYIRVDATIEDVDVPVRCIKDGKIVFNISSLAVFNLSMKNDAISFVARFGGTPYSVYIPINAVEAIYPHGTMPRGNNTLVMSFKTSNIKEPITSVEKPKKPVLTIVK